jgi:hypothetical protein
VLAQRLWRGFVVAALLFVAACNGPLDVDRLSASGSWIIYFGAAGSDFQLDLTESEDGLVQGTWSFPDQFAYHRIWGHRTGAILELTADSHNLLPVTFDMEFTSPDRMEGFFYFGGETESISLRRAPGSGLDR